MGLDIKKESEYAKHLKSVHPEGVISISKKTDGAVVSTEKVESVGGPQVVPSDKLAYVSYKGKRVVNLGNYQSASVEVGLTMPSHVDFIADAYLFALGWVDERMTDLTKDVK